MEIFFQEFEFGIEESIISSITSEKPNDYYKRVISSYKAELEMWYQSKRSFVLDFQLIFLTARVIIFPEKKFYGKWFKDLAKRSF